MATKTSTTPSSSKQTSLAAAAAEAAKKQGAAAASSSPAPAAAPAATTNGKSKGKIPPAKKAAIKIGALVLRTASLEGKYSYTSDLKTALESARRWLETAKATAEKLPDNFKPDRKGESSSQTIAVGTKVTLREKRREMYAGLLSADEIKAGVEVISLHGHMLATKTAKGTAFFPKAHLKIAGAPEAASAEVAAS